MIFKNLGSLLMKLALLITCILLTCVSLCHKGLKKHLVMKINITKCLWIQLQKTKISPAQKKRYSILPECTDVHIRQDIHQKDLNLSLTSCYYAKVVVELEKTQTRNSVVVVFLFFLLIIIRPSSTFNFWSVFGFNEYLSGILSLMNVESFWFHVWVVVARLLILQHKWPQVTFWPMSKNKKLEFKDHQIHFKMLRKILKKEV